MSAQSDFSPDAPPDFAEALRADADTLAARGFASNFVAAWLAFWPYVSAGFGAELEKAYRDTFPDKPPKSAAKIVASCARTSMALMSAAVRADKFRAQRRRFHCTAWALESYRAGLELLPDGLPADESRRQRANLSRYWRGHWALLHLFQCVTGLNLFPRTARDWKENRASHEAAAYTDNATDLFLEIAGRGGRRRSNVSRVARFEQATAGAVENFRRRFGHYAPEWRLPEPAAPEPKEPKPARGRARVRSFRRAKEKAAEAVEILTARAEAGKLTPEEADEFLLTLAPAVEAAARVVSSKRDGVTSEDTPPDFGEPAAENLPRASADEKNSFPKKSGEPGEATADKNIRRAEAPAVTLDAFLAAFRPTPAEPVNLRAFAPKGAPAEPRFEARKIPASRAALTEGGGLLAQLRKVNGACGLYFVVNQGGDRDDEINRVTAFFAEADDQDITEQHAKLDACPLPPLIRVETRKSVHAYWLAAPGCSIEEWREVQKRLIHYFGSDPKIKNPSRVMRLPGFNHVTYTNGLLDFKPVTLAAFDPSRRYTAAEMLAAFPAPPESERRPVNLFTPRRAASNLEEHKRQLGERIVRHESARRNGAGKWDCRGVCHGGKGSTGLFYDPADNGVICNSGCDLATISAAFGLAMPERGAQTDGRERGTI